MNQCFFYNKEESAYIRACLIFAKRLGFIDDDSFEAAELRMQKENEKRQQQLKKGESVYGVVHFSFPAYLQYELTRFRLAFVAEGKELKKKYSYPEITHTETVNFWNEHRELFTRYMGDHYAYHEVALIIKKRIREMQYEREIQDILRQF